jgi:uncharacterized protein YndB with AHSA1/START domain
MIRKSVLLACPPERAFALFTERAGEWWPVSRRHTGDPASQIRIVASGRFWERAGDGTEVELGRVRAWDPPRRLVLDFYPGTDPDHPTDLEVTFAAEGEGTRVTVVHGPTPASAGLWAERAPRFEGSWDQVLAAFAVAAAP